MLSGMHDVQELGVSPDGITDNSSALQFAIGASKGHVVLTPGQYVASGLTIPSGVKLVGMPGAVLKHLPGATTPCVQIQDNAIDAGIYDLTIDGNSPNQDTDVQCIQVGGIGSEVVGCKVYDAKYDAMFVRPNAKRCSIVGNRVYEVNAAAAAGRYGITIGGNVIGDAPTQILIQGNHVRKTNDGGLGIVGIAVDTLFDGNIVEQAISGDGIACYNRGNLRTLISNNLLDECGNNGIHAGGTDIQIVNNLIRKITFQGIVLASDPNGDPTASVNGLIAGNLVDDTDDAVNGAGIVVKRFDHVGINGNAVLNASTHGIQLVDCNHCSISGGAVRASGGQGVRVEGSAFLALGGGLVVSGGAGDGIRILQFQRLDLTVLQSNNISISGATIVNNAGWGIQSQHTSGRVILDGCVIRINTAGAHTLVGAGNIVGDLLTA